MSNGVESVAEGVIILDEDFLLFGGEVDESFTWESEQRTLTHRLPQNLVIRIKVFL